MLAMLRATWRAVTTLLPRPVRQSRHQHTGNRVVVITGCDSGLGYSISVDCCQAGLSVVSGCLNLESAGARALQPLCHVWSLDVTDSESVSGFCRKVDALLHGTDNVLHAVVNNAGMMVFGEFEWLTEELARRQIEVNQIGAMRVARVFLPQLREHKGRLINVTSHCALSSLPGLSVYGATKAAVQNWSEGLRVEQAKYGVKVITFIPGSFIAQSNIMARQGEYAAAMRSHMSEKNWQFHGDYFTTFNRYLTEIPVTTDLTCIRDAGLYSQFRRAMLDENPQAQYINEPWRYFWYYTVFKVMPCWLRDVLVEKFVNFPKYSKV